MAELDKLDRRGFLIASASGAALVVAGCSSDDSNSDDSDPGTTTPGASTTEAPSTTVPPTVGHLRIAAKSFGGQEGFDFINNSSQSANTMHGLVYDFFVHTDQATGQLVPGTLQSFEISSDGLSWDLKLREGLVFHNGTPATSEDLMFTLQGYMSEEAQSAEMASACESVEIVDDLTVRVVTKGVQPLLSAFMTNTTPNSGNLVSKAYYDELGWDAASAAPIGVGPWIFESGTLNDSYHYTRNEEYWGQKPLFDELTTILVPELATQLSLLETGDVDMIAISIDDLDSVQDSYESLLGFAPQHRCDFYGAYDPRAEGMPVADIRVREALTRAVDFEAIAESLQRGLAFPQYPPRALRGMPLVDPKWSDYAIELWSYDPDKAKALLAEAGFPDGFQIKLGFRNPPTVQQAAEIAQVVQSYWAEIGVEATLEGLEGDRFALIRGPVDDYVGQAFIGGTTGFSPATLNIGYIWGRGANSLVCDTREEPFTVFVPELVELYEAATAEPDPDKRKLIIDDWINLGLDLRTGFAFGQVPSVFALSPDWELVDYPPEAVVNNESPCFFTPFLRKKAG